MEIIFIIAPFIAGVVLSTAVIKIYDSIKAKAAADAQALAAEATAAAKKL